MYKSTAPSENVPLLMPVPSVPALKNDHGGGSRDKQQHDDESNNSRFGFTSTNGVAAAASWNMNSTRTISWLILASLMYLIGLGHVLLNKLPSGNNKIVTFTRQLDTDDVTTRGFGSSNLQLQQEFVLSSSLPDAASTSNNPQQPLNDDAGATPPHRPVEILIVYGPPDDPWQKEMALAVLEGCQSVIIPSAEKPSSLVCKLMTVETATFTKDVQHTSAIIIGSSVENANTHYTVQQWIDQQWNIREMKSNKIGAAFVTAGGISAGQENTLKSLLQSMMIFKMIVMGGETWESAFGVAAITGEPPFTTTSSSSRRTVEGNQHHEDGSSTSPESFFPPECYLSPGEIISPMFIEQAKGLGRRVARVTVSMTSR